MVETPWCMGDGDAIYMDEEQRVVAGTSAGAGAAGGAMVMDDAGAMVVARQLGSYFDLSLLCAQIILHGQAAVGRVLADPAAGAREYM
jgi:peptidase E